MECFGNRICPQPSLHKAEQSQHPAVPHLPSASAPLIIFSGPPQLLGEKETWDGVCSKILLYERLKGKRCPVSERAACGLDRNVQGGNEGEF